MKAVPFRGPAVARCSDRGTVVEVDLRVAGKRLRRNKTPRCEVDASRRGLTFGSNTSLLAHLQNIPVLLPGKPQRAAEQRLCLLKGCERPFQPTASARAILQRILSAGCPPLVAMAGQSTLSRQRSGSMPSPRAISAVRASRRRAALLRVGGRMSARGLSQGRGHQRFLLRRGRAVTNASLVTAGHPYKGSVVSCAVEPCGACSCASRAGYRPGSRRT